MQIDIFNLAICMYAQAERVVRVVWPSGEASFIPKDEDITLDLILNTKLVLGLMFGRA